MKKQQNIKQKIIFYVMSTAVSVVTLTLAVMAFTVFQTGSISRALIFSVLTAAVTLLLASIGVRPVADQMASSILSATTRLQALAEGNLTDEVVLSENGDETDLLTEALAKTTASLNTYVQDISTCLAALSTGDYTIEIPDHFDGDFSSIHDSLCTISDSLNHTMHQMNDSSIGITKNSSEVSAYAKQLHDGSLSQEDLIVRIEESMAAITKSIEKNQDDVLQIEQSSQNSSDTTAIGDRYMRHMLKAMNEIQDSLEEISSISHLIEDISSQTNLLSLNASIEAARAGEAGRGFAVVASEIGQLSNQTTDALHKTGEIISRITGTIKKGLELAEHTASSFRDIQAVTEQYHEISARLYDTAMEQSDTVTSMNEQLLSLKDIAGDNRALAEEADKLASDSLSQSEDLQNYVALFKRQDDYSGMP